MAKVKIDRIPVDMYRTVYKKDAYGNRLRERERYTGYKKVKGISTGLRFVNFIVDYICFEIIYQSVLFMIQLVLLGGSSEPAIVAASLMAAAVTGLVIYPAFYIAFEATLQRTPGKFITRSMVVNDYNEKPDLSTILLRSVIRIVPFEALSCFSDTNRCWHDRWSNTYVISSQEHEELKALQDQEMLKP